MLDHTGFNASDYQRSVAWYKKALAPIGYGLLMELPAKVAGVDVAGFGEIITAKPDFWITGTTPVHSPGIHFAFRVSSRAQVDAFYKAALVAGGVDNGAPGLRPHYHAHYYAAFVRDPDGHNIEAVCHEPA